MSANELSTETFRKLPIPERAFHVVQAELAGAAAFADGRARVVPRALLLEHGADVARAWYRGWDEANLAAPVTTRIASNGSKWAGEAPDTVEQLIEVLGSGHALDSARFNGFVHPQPDGSVQFFGNFADLSHVFNITTDDPEVIDALSKAIAANLASGTEEEEPVGHTPTYDRNETIAEIRAGLKRRSGKAWSVRGGRGTSWGWITITAPPGRRDEYGAMTDADRIELSELLGKPVHHQGESVPPQQDYRTEYVDRAQGRAPSRIGVPQWD